MGAVRRSISPTRLWERFRLAWVRGIRDECDAAGIALFHKQYYIGNQLQYDGLLDGQVRQEFPVTVAS